MLFIYSALFTLLGNGPFSSLKNYILIWLLIFAAWSFLSPLFKVESSIIGDKTFDAIDNQHHSLLNLHMHTMTQGPIFIFWAFVRPIYQCRNFRFCTVGSLNMLIDTSPRCWYDWKNFKTILKVFLCYPMYLYRAGLSTREYLAKYSIVQET